MSDSFNTVESSDNTDDNIYLREVAKWRGTIIHRVIEQLCKTAAYPATQQIINRVQQQIKKDLLLNNSTFIEYLNECVQEAVATFNHANLKTIFKPASGSRTYNEMPLMYKQKQRGVYGIIGRVIKSKNDITIVDYKSHQLNENETTQDVALQFSTQLDYYRSGIKKL